MKQQRNTRQRQLVLDVVRGRRDHPTAEQIYQSVREQDAHVSRGTVYRNLNLLCDNREIYRVVMSNSDRFDLPVVTAWWMFPTPMTAPMTKRWSRKPATASCVITWWQRAFALTANVPKRALCNNFSTR